MSQQPKHEALQILEGLWGNTTYSDLLICCDNKQYPVHRAVICPRSAFFEAACRDCYKEGNTGIITLNHDDPQAVKLMLYYLYHLDYPDDEIEQPFLPTRQAAHSAFRNPRTDLINDLDDENNKLRVKSSKKSKQERGTNTDNAAEYMAGSHMVLHARMYAMGEKYGIFSLKSTALAKFKQKSAVYGESDDFLQAATEVYTSTLDNDRAMRDAVVDTFCKNPEILDREVVQAMLRNNDALCFDVLMQFRNGFASYAWTRS